MSVVKGKLRPLRNTVLVSDMSFEEQTTASGIVIQSDDGKSHGVKPRWARVWSIGPEQNEVKLGEWIYIEHGRWTRGIKVEEDGKEIVIRRVDTDAILLQSDEKPNDVYIAKGIEVQEAVDAYRLENK
jgi:co-chaperonin GroES (HSP10)